MYNIYCIQIKRQEIQQLLENDEVIEVLNFNSSQHIQQSQSIEDSGYLITWKYLLNCYHRSLIRVSEIIILYLNATSI